MKRSTLVFKLGQMNRVIAIIFLMTASTSFLQEVEKDESKKDRRHHSFYYEGGGLGLFFGSVNYDYRIHLGDVVSIAPRIGAGIYAGLFPVWELNMQLGGQQHLFEIGGGGYAFFGEGEVGVDWMYRAGYRYQGNKGFLFRIAPQYYRLGLGDGTIEHRFWAALSLGYSF